MIKRSIYLPAGWYSHRNQVGLCSQLPEILTLFKVAEYNFDGLQQPNFYIVTLENFPRWFLPLYYFTFYLLSLLPLSKCQQMAKMNDRVPICTSRFNHVFLKIYLYDPTSKFRNKKLARFKIHAK